MFAVWLITLIGFLVCLGVVGWIFVHYLRVALNNEDAITIDPLPKDKKNNGLLK